MTIVYSTSLFVMALNKKKLDFIRDPSDSSYYAASSIPLSVRQYYFDYYITSEH